METTNTPQEPLPASLEDAQRRIRELEAVASLRRRQIDSMQQLSDALFEMHSVPELIRKTLETAVDVLGCDGGSVMIYEPKEEVLAFRHVIGPVADKFAGVTIPADAGIAGAVFQSAEPMIVNDTSNNEMHEDLSRLSGYGVRSLVCAPLKVPKARPLGVITVVNGKWEFAENDSDVLVVLAGMAANAMEQARLSQEARKTAIVHLIGDISHDIKNMLTPIQTGVWTLQPMLDELIAGLDRLVAEYPDQQPWATAVKSAVDNVREDYGWILESAVDAADKVQERTKQIADAVKGDLAPPHFEPGDLNQTAKDVTGPTRLVAEAAGLKVLLDLQESLPSIEFDRKQMYNALYNLVNNAIPETDEGGSVTVRTRASDAGVTIEVADTGRGMPDHVRERLFTEEAISTKPGGTGLGTKIVGDVIRRHHGTIRVESEAGKGTTFVIALPLTQPAGD